MNTPSAFFTASRLAAAQGIARTLAYHQLRPIKHLGVARQLNGVRVTVWPVEKLPASVASKLRPIVARKGYCSLAHLLAAPPEPWQPEHPISLLAEAANETAEQRRAVLAPILAAADAQTVAISKLVERALAGFAESDWKGAGGKWSVRNWIEAAIERDRGLWDWQRLEIYLDEKPPLKSDREKEDALLYDAGGNALAGALLAIEKQENVTEGARANVWHEAFRRFLCLVAGGVGEAKAKRTVMTALSSSKAGILPDAIDARSVAWKRQFKKWEEGGQCADAFTDRRAFNTKARSYDLTPEEENALRDYRLKKSSLDLALYFFVNDPACRPETRRLIEETREDAARRLRLPNWPMSLRRAGHVKVEEKAKFRGDKAMQNLEHSAHRGLWFPGPDGEQIPLRPNTVWESDDMSTNEPFSYLDPESGKILVGRQTLCTQDVYSRAWLSTMPIGRIRDAYRVEDVADHILETVLSCGLPDWWRIEKGVWENNFIDGIPLSDGTRWGGLGTLFHIERVHKSKQKGGVEVGFDHLQDFQAHFSLTIGRKRGEFEKGTKTMLKAKAGDESAAMKFWSAGEYADSLRDTMRFLNAKPKQRRAFGRDVRVPDDLYRDFARRDCPAEELWRFCPIKKLATVRQGHVEVSVPYYPRPFTFRVNGEAEIPYVEHGYPVLIAFHPGHPERGCHVFNAERGARNRDNLSFAQFMVLAPSVGEAPQFGGSPNDPALLARKKANAAVHQEFRSIVNSSNKISVVRDSHGQSVRRETGSAPSVISETPPAQSIKAQRAERRKKEAEAYLDKAATVNQADEASFLAKLEKREREAKESMGIYDV